MNTRRIFQRGMTIIELMVGLVVGMLLALAVLDLPFESPKPPGEFEGSGRSEHPEPGT